MGCTRFCSCFLTPQKCDPRGSAGLRRLGCKGLSFKYFLFLHFFIIFPIHTQTASSSKLILYKIFFVEELSILQHQKLYLINQIDPLNLAILLPVFVLCVMDLGEILLTDKNCESILKPVSYTGSV